MQRTRRRPVGDPYSFPWPCDKSDRAGFYVTLRGDLVRGPYYHQTKAERVRELMIADYHRLGITIQESWFDIVSLRCELR